MGHFILQVHRNDIFPADALTADLISLPVKVFVCVSVPLAADLLAPRAPACDRPSHSTIISFCRFPPSSIPNPLPPLPAHVKGSAGN